MPHETALIATIALGLALAFVLGFVALRLGLPPLVGYLLSGIAVGPFTPGFVADSGLAGQLAEIGVILLMFGVGIHFSPRELLAVRRIAVPGALAQIAVATLLGAGLARAWGWPWSSCIVFGLTLSVASTVVLLRTLEDRRTLDSVDGRIAVGWLIVEDLVTVLVVVLLPVAAGSTAAHDGANEPERGVLATLAITLAEIGVFGLIMFVVGRRVVPWLLVQVARTGSRELFTLAVLAVALGIAFGAAATFGVSFALGAFLAGVVVGESDTSHQAASDALPLQDAFGVLFFVAVGMLFDPRVLIDAPLRVLLVLTIVVVGKSIAAIAIVLLFRYPLGTALTVGASLAQIGEFSFILAGMGVTLGMLSREGQSLVVAVALLSITMNPLAFRAAAAAETWIRARPKLLLLLERPAGAIAELPIGLRDAPPAEHVVIVGHGRVGAPIAGALESAGVPYVVIEQNREVAERLRARSMPVIWGDAARPGILEQAHLRSARLLVIATPDPLQARAMLAIARRANPKIDVIARTHVESERRWLERHGASHVVMGERELSSAMTRLALADFEASAPSEDRERVDPLRDRSHDAG